MNVSFDNCFAILTTNLSIFMIKCILKKITSLNVVLKRGCKYEGVGALLQDLLYII